MAFRNTALALGLATSVIAAPANAAEIVTSVKPLALLVKAVAGDSAEVTTLVPPGSNPHNYSMKPSQRRTLDRADAIFWVGPELETFLARLLTGPEFEARAVAFMAVEKTANDHDHAHESHEDHHDGHEEHHEDHHDEAHHHEEATDHHGDAAADHDGHQDHGHNHGDGEDPHIWVDPDMALEMAHTIRERLETVEGLDQQQLDANLASFQQQLTATERTIQEQLEAVSGISLFAYHSAFNHFAEHYGLNLEGLLTLNPELSPGARHIAEVQEQLRQANQPCLLTEPQFNRQWWHSITEDMDVTFSTWDALATDIEPSREGYIQFQQSIANAVMQCLPEQAEH